ncbi:MAG: zinc ABC transporter substrate-binding protein, partial [Opitutae bacterium]|nr:zinc ABC transporter substrate-binding protein [Opitutae bacterium]
GTILDSATTEAADPSAKKFAALATTIRRGKLPIFVDNTVDDRVPAALAKEAGVAAPRKIRVDALDAPNTPAGTYIGMMRENFRTIAEACSTTN